MKRSYIRLFLIVVAAIFITLALYFIFRNQLLKQTVQDKVNNFNDHREVKVQFEKVYFKGVKTIRLDSLSVTSTPNDTLLSIHSLSARINLWQLVSGHIRFRNLTVKNASIHFEQNKMDSYYRSFSRKDGIHYSDSSAPNLYARTEHLLRRVFAMIPSKLVLDNFCIVYSLDSIKVLGTIDHLRFKNGKFASTLQLKGSDLIQIAEIAGTVKPMQHAVELSINPQNEKLMLLSPMAGLFGAELRYKSFNIKFVEKGKKGKLLRLEGHCSLGQFQIDHNAVSSKNITFPGFAMNFNLVIGTNYLELDSISEINIGDLNIHPYLKYIISPADTISFSCNIPSFTVNDFFTSVPADLFPRLAYVEADGSIAYRTKLIVDLKQPDSLLLESKLNTKNFKIRHIDNELLKMNSSFSYSAYEKGKLVRTIIIGPDNPDYLQLDEVPVLLQSAILLAEDGSFYSHEGFLLNAIRRAIAENIKEKRFYRGGSTISQQLVKNVYLSHEKTISRKLEEVILVWLIESNNLVSKHRMFEVYLNIIEWGPNVYGPKEAARFYFQKNVGQLNAEECIFLASVIPSPKKFYYRFDKTGRLAPFMVNYYADMSEKLLHKGLLTSANGDSLSSLLTITGLAKEYLRFDTVLIDSVQTLDVLIEGQSE